MESIESERAVAQIIDRGLASAPVPYIVLFWPTAVPTVRSVRSKNAAAEK